VGGDAVGVAGCPTLPETAVCVAHEPERALASLQRAVHRLQLLLLHSQPLLMLPSVLARNLYSRQ